jgi:hypothetical protein
MHTWLTFWIGRRVEVKDTALSDLIGFRGVVSRTEDEAVFVDIPGRGQNKFSRNELIPL